MVKSDGNGAMIVDKKLWVLMMSALTVLLGLVVWGGQSIALDVKENTKANAAQSVQILNLIEQRKEMLDLIRDMRSEVKTGQAEILARIGKR